MVSNSVVGCILNSTEKEEIDLIAMHTRGRKGSATNDVRNHTTVEVQAFGSAELAELAAK